jgi:hypothetical protein
MDTSSEQQPASTANATEDPVHGANDTAPLWLQRASLTMLVVTCIYLGLLLLILPWTRYWQDNRLLAMFPERVTNFLETGAARGLASGLGVLDIWIGISELTHPHPRSAHGGRQK